MRAANRHLTRRGATFVVWLMLMGTVFFAVIASLLSGESAQYGRAVEEARLREALYLAEGGLAKALAAARRGEVTAPREFEYDHGRGRVTVVIEPAAPDGGWTVRSTATIRQVQHEWRETITTRLTGSGAAARLEDYHWVQNYD